jgi:hypothetical protein
MGLFDDAKQYFDNTVAGKIASNLGYLSDPVRVENGLSNFAGRQFQNTLTPFGLNPTPTGPFAQGAYRDPSQAFTAAGRVQNSTGYSPQQQAQAQGYNMDLLNQLNAQAHGQGPSLATQQMQQGMDANAKQAMALMAANRGGNPGFAQYAAGQNLANANQNTAANAGMARTQEQLNAQGLLGSLGQGVANQAMNNNQFNAGEYNRALGYDTRAQNDLAQLQNQQIGNQAGTAQQYNLQFRNGLLNAGIGAGGQGLQAIGQGLPGMAQIAPALLGAL